LLIMGFITGVSSNVYELLLMLVILPAAMLLPVMLSESLYVSEETDTALLLASVNAIVI